MRFWSFKSSNYNDSKKGAAECDQDHDLEYHSLRPVRKASIPLRTFRFLDLTRHTNHAQLINVIFYLHVLSFGLVTFSQVWEGKLFYDFVQQSKPEDMAKNWRNFWISFGIQAELIIAGSNCVITLGLARRPNQTETKLKFYLRYYKAWNTIMTPISVALLIYKRVSLLPSGNDRVIQFVSSIIILCFVVALKIYLVLMVIRVYHKLGSRVIERLQERRKQEKEEESAVFHSSVNMYFPSGIDDEEDYSDSGVKQKENKKELEFTPSLRISDETFQSNIINPLSISIDKTQFVGEGQFGAVYLGILRRKDVPKIEVAVKIVKDSESGETLQMLLQEIKIAIWAGHHPNIVEFFGISSDASLNAHCAIVTDYCALGNLERFLVDNRHTFVNMLTEHGNVIYKDQKLYINLDIHGTHSSLDLIRFAHQIAMGMDHLSSRKIIHGDLAARNVLLTKDLLVKLTDFGMSRRLYGYQTYLSDRTSQTDQFLPWRWMSYEALKDLKFSIKSDVWAYGVVLWEIFTLGAFPFEKRKWNPELLDDIQKGLRLQRPAFAPLEIYNVMQKCWELEPSKRPSFKGLVNEWVKLHSSQNQRTKAKC